jgi:hypothetical protein
MSFEKAFINQSLRIILSPRYWEFSPMKLRKSFHIGTEVDIWNTKTQSENHCIHLNSVLRTPTNLYYSPIKKLENIFIFKISSQQRP